MVRSLAPLAAAALALAGCASTHQPDPPHVTLAGIEPLSGEGLEARVLLKLRVENPNDAPINYDGIYVELDVLDKSFASFVARMRFTCKNELNWARAIVQQSL